MLLSYASSLAPPGPAAQLVAVVVAIRAARGGVGNLTGADLSALRLGDAREAVDALRCRGWQIGDALFDDDPATPIPITVPDLISVDDHRFPSGRTYARGCLDGPRAPCPPSRSRIGSQWPVSSRRALTGQSLHATASGRCPYLSRVSS